MICAKLGAMFPWWQEHGHITPQYLTRRGQKDFVVSKTLSRGSNRQILICLQGRWRKVTDNYCPFCKEILTVESYRMRFHFVEQLGYIYQSFYLWTECVPQKKCVPFFSRLRWEFSRLITNWEHLDNHKEVCTTKTCFLLRLETAIYEILESISLEKLQKLAASMPKHLREIIKRQRYPTHF